MLKTLCFRVKSIYCHKLFPVREVGKTNNWLYLLYHSVKVYEVICYNLYTVSNAFYKSTKTLQTNTLLSIAFSTFSIRLIIVCAVENFF